MRHKRNKKTITKLVPNLIKLSQNMNTLLTKLESNIETNINNIPLNDKVNFYKQLLNKELQ